MKMHSNGHRLRTVAIPRMGAGNDMPSDDRCLAGNTMVRIYWTRFEEAVSSGLEREYCAMMPERVRAAARTYVRWQDRQATLFGKLLLLKGLRALLPAGDWLGRFQALEVTPSGKPFIPGGPEFSISHSGEMVVVALSQSGEVGIDIEKIRAIEVDDFSNYVPEIAGLKGKLGDDQLSTIFFDCWTRKEAVLKGYGSGLSVPLDQVVIQGDMAHLHDTAWFIHKIVPDQAYCCHVATRQPLRRVDLEHTDFMNGFLF